MTAYKASDVVGGYKPTKEDLEKIKHKMNCFKLSGDGVFHTIQGEGPYTGYPTTFVRLQGCNLHCTYCDTPYSWKTDMEEYYKEPYDVEIAMLSEEIIKAQKKAGLTEAICPSVVFTGGEPLLQQSKIQKWHEKNSAFQLMVETNGTVKPSDYILENSYISCSPKLLSSGNTNEIAIKKAVIQAIASKPYNTFKFVCMTEEDIDEVLRIVEENEIPFNMVAIMPEGISKEENARCFELIMPKILSTGLRVTPRYHNVMYPGALRGV